MALLKADKSKGLPTKPAVTKVCKIKKFMGYGLDVCSDYVIYINSI